MLQQRTFFGQEKKAVPALLGALNLVLHGVTAPRVYRRNTLEENIRQVTERYDVVLTNPPFGGTEGKHIQENFPVQSNATELLFVQHIMKKLSARDGAGCGMVVPEGTLFRGGAFATVKKDLLENFNLFLVVSLPPGTFSPYSDVKTALLFFKRPGPTKEVLYYEMPLLEGLKKFSKGSPIADEHFNEAGEIWKRWKDYLEGKAPRLNGHPRTIDMDNPPLPPFRKGGVGGFKTKASRPENTSTSWVEDVEGLAKRGYDLSAKNPNRTEGEKLPSPMEIVAGLMEKEREILSIVEELDEMLTNNQNERNTR